jgi:hypothetical protein
VSFPLLLSYSLGGPSVQLSSMDSELSVATARRYHAVSDWDSMVLVHVFCFFRLILEPGPGPAHGVSWMVCHWIWCSDESVLEKKKF